MMLHLISLCELLMDSVASAWVLILGKLSISYCFNRSSFNHLDGFHLEVLNSIIRNFAVRKNQVWLTTAKQKSGSARSL